MALETATELLGDLNATLDALAAVDLTPADVTEALALTRATEVVGRRVRALQVGVVGCIEESRVYRTDGHRSAVELIGHAGKLDCREAKRRAKAGRALDALPVVAAGFAAGRVGFDQVVRIARTFANPRVRERFIELDVEIASLAMRLPYDEFDRRLTNWEAAADEDGTADRSRANHENRDARDAQDYDGGWRGHHRGGSLDGAQMHVIHAKFIEIEFQIDWDEAFAIHGDATTVAHLARTDAQRRFDALLRIHLLAADAHAASPGGAPIDLITVMDDETFERHLARIDGADPEPRQDLHLAHDGELDPDLLDSDDESDLGPESGLDSDYDSGSGSGPSVAPTGEEDPAEAPAPSAGQLRRTGFRSSTIDGHFIDPTEATANALVSHVRRAVIGADSVIIDLSRRQRLFTGPSQLATRLAGARCYWPGCNRPATQSQTDHLTGWKAGGSTNPGNGAPCCGHHNRHKEHGYIVWRDKRGRIHVRRPDGTELD